MRSFIVIGALVALAGCNAAGTNTPTKVSWQYGAGNGDGVTYSGPAPKYNRAYGWGADQVTTPAGQASPNYAWGADGQSGTMVQVAPQAKQQLAAPTPAPNPTPTAAERAAAPGTHS